MTDPTTALDDLMAREVAGEELRLLHFWGHRRDRSGAVGRGCFSQWWEQEFVVDGVGYASAEHWMMAQKATLFGDLSMAGRILASGSPGAAKALGRAVTGFDEHVWEAARFDIVVRGNRAKFGQHRELADVLLRTGDQVLVEASPQDAVWGIGLAAHDPRASSPTAWRGLNLLGFEVPLLARTP